MAENKKISGFDINPSIDGTEDIPTEKGGSNFRNTYDSLKTWLQKVLNFVDKISITSLRASSDNPNVVYITDANKEGAFNYDPTDTTSSDNGGTILVDASSKRYKREFSGFVAAEWFGALGDGSTDDSTAIQNALNVGSVELEEKTYILSSNIFVPSGSWLKGLGHKTIIQSDVTFISGVVINVNAEGKCSDFKLIGDAAFTHDNITTDPSFPEDLAQLDALLGEGDLIGIETSSFQFSIVNVFFTQFSKTALLLVANGISISSQPLRNDILSNVFYLNYRALHEPERAEYATVSNNDFKYNIINIVVDGGNNSHVNNKIDHARFNVVLNGGALINNSHGEFTGGSINHAKIYALVAREVSNGEIFTGISIFDGGSVGILIENSRGISMQGCTFSQVIIDANGVYDDIANQGQNKISDCFFRDHSLGGNFPVIATGNTLMYNNESMDGNEEDSAWDTQMLNNSKYDREGWFFKNINGENSIIGHDVAEFYVGSSNVAGSLKVKIPTFLGNQTIRIELEITDLNGNTSELSINGYMATTGWTGVNVTNKTNDTTYVVDFGVDGSGNGLMYFGATNLLWRFDLIRITKITAFRGVITNTKTYKYGWEMEITSEAHQNITATFTP